MRTITHHQLATDVREKRDTGDYMHDRRSTQERARMSNDFYARHYQNGHKRRPSWETKKERINGGYSFFGPGWVLPRVVATVTGSIVWGSCGKMADLPEY